MHPSITLIITHQISHVQNCVPSSILLNSPLLPPSPRTFYNTNPVPLLANLNPTLITDAVANTCATVLATPKFIT